MFLKKQSRLHRFPFFFSMLHFCIMVRRRVQTCRCRDLCICPNAARAGGYAAVACESLLPASAMHRRIFTFQQTACLLQLITHAELATIPPLGFTHIYSPGAILFFFLLLFFFCRISICLNTISQKVEKRRFNTGVGRQVCQQHQLERKLNARRGKSEGIENMTLI